MQIKQFLIIGTQQFFSSTPMLSQNVTLAITAHNLGQHFSQICLCCFYHIRDLRRIRRYMYFAVAKTIATALVSSRRYYNSLYHNIALNDILKLQRVHILLARVVTRSPSFSHSLPLLKSLHWLSAFCDLGN